MTKVRAFVGHSFLDKDKDVVRCFTDYIDTLKGSLPDFDWVHATEPRTDGVPDKVLELMNGRNLFIGICTKNERVSEDSYFSKTYFGNMLKIEERELKWKPSDWIIQEIGLAIGKDMKLILLVEEGVRPPGGLFGSLEYIEFSRENPQQAFQNLTGMINSVSKDGQTKQSLAIGGSVSGGQLENEAEDQTTDWWQREPDSSWEKFEYYIQQHLALFNENEERTKQISEAYLKHVGGEDTPEGATWQADCLFERIKWNKGGSLQDILDLAKANENNPEVLKYTARASLHYQDDLGAKKYFGMAAQVELDLVKKVELLGDLAALEQDDQALSTVKKICDLIDSPEVEKKALSTLRELDKLFEEDVYRQAMLEREIQIDPTDIGRRFALAYLHTQHGNEALALHHYLKIPEFERDSVTWNNLGVIFRLFSMVSKSTSAYRRSVEKDETLAMSNLAHIYMDAGFLKEATELLNKAQSSDNCHDNVASAQVKLNNISGNEDKKLSETLARVFELSQFLSSVGQQLLQVSPEKIARIWSGDLYQLKATFEQEAFRAEGTFEVKAGGLGAALDQSNLTEYNVNYQGKIVGRTIAGTRTETRIDSLSSNSTGSLLSGTLSNNRTIKSSFVFVISEDGQSAKCLNDNKFTQFTLSEQ